MTCRATERLGSGCFAFGGFGLNRWRRGRAADSTLAYWRTVI